MHITGIKDLLQEERLEDSDINQINYFAVVVVSIQTKHKKMGEGAETILQTSI